MAKRDPKNAWMPKNVYFKKGRYVVVASYKPWEEEYLCSGDSTQHQVWSAHDRWANKGKDSVNALVHAYQQSDEFKRLAPATQEHYTRLLDSLCKWVTPRLKVEFGTLKLSQVGNKTIQSAYDQQPPTVARNRRFKVFSIVCSWGIQRFSGIDRNPVTGLRLMKEHPRDRYVSDSEYEFIYNLASPMLKLMMEGAYLLRARRAELSKLERLGSIKENGVLIERSKDSWDGVVKWSPRLKQWITDCKALHASRVSKYLIHNQHGGQVSKSSLDSMWRRVWAKAEELEGCPPRFTFHDLKAKGVTDHPQKEGGHKSAKMKAVYDRENRIEEPTK